jgi:fructokinase
MAVIGLDIGGTKIEIALIVNDKIILQNRTPTERHKGYEHIVSNVGRLISDSLKESSLKLQDFKGIGIGLPGAIDPISMKMINGNTQAFIGHDFIGDLKKELQTTIDIKCANDANCFALAESVLGVGKSYSVSAIGVGIILGTGCGSGITIDQKIFRGSRGGAGEAGHTTLHENGRDCYCGKNGCAELYLSGHGVEEQYFQSNGVRKKANLILEDDKLRKKYANDLAKFLSNLTNIIDPDYFVLGGGLSKFPRLYEDVEGILEQKQFLKNCPPPKIHQHLIGDSAGVLGAALIIETFHLDLNNS